MSKKTRWSSENLKIYEDLISRKSFKSVKKRREKEKFATTSILVLKCAMLKRYLACISTISIEAFRFFNIDNLRYLSLRWCSNSLGHAYLTVPEILHISLLLLWHLSLPITRMMHNFFIYSCSGSDTLLDIVYSLSNYLILTRY
jgi:hypothetical protein